MKSQKIIALLLIVILSIHFIFVLLTQCYQQNWSLFKTKSIEKINNNYINPYFEQNWGMFAPNPPHGNQYIAIQFYTKKDSTELINIHQKIMQSSFKRFFSLDQRILKYFNACYNDILIKKANNYSNTDFIKKSHGLQSILNYSKIVLQNQKIFIKNRQPNDSIYINLYLIDEPLNNYKYSTIINEKFYIDIKGIYLTSQQKIK